MFRRLVAVQYSHLMSGKMRSSHRVKDYVSRADTCLTILDAAALKVDVKVVVRAVVSFDTLALLQISCCVLSA